MAGSGSLQSCAIGYAKKGIPLFPCKKDKTPITQHGFKEATTDIKTIKKWWRENPSASIGMPTGEVCGMWVLDIDGAEGYESLEKLEKEHGKLPETLRQKTGGGGEHIFFKYNGTPIKNSSNQVAKKIDVRGNGGYVILAPSPHVSGNDYRWLKRAKPAHAPKWLIDLVHKKPGPGVRHTPTYGTTSYGQAALANEVITLSSAPDGSRNQTLNDCAFAIAQLVAGGELDEGTARSSLKSMALTVGLDEKETDKTIDSAFKAGFEYPRQGKKSHGSHGSHACHSMSLDVTECHALSRNVTHVTPQKQSNKDRFQGNLTAEIRDFIKENQGSFTTADIDRDFGLHHSQDKAARRKVMSRLLKEKIIRKDIRVSGKYHILKTEISFIDFSATDPSPFNLELPLGLSTMVRIPRKSIVIAAGTNNSGKTGLAIEVLKHNLSKSYDLMYLMSEMGDSEYKSRITNCVSDVNAWANKVQASNDCLGGWGNAISQYNPNGLTVIDFLEEIEGEYFRIPSDLRAIYDGLEEGVAFVCIQKHSKADVGRGGEGTAEKPRLYLTIDQLVYEPQSTISAVKIYKAKEYIDKNPNGLECHVRFWNDGTVERVSEWMYCNAAQREKWKQHYQNRDKHAHKDRGNEGLCMYFTTQRGASVRVVEDQLNTWREKYKNINVDAELLKISRDSEKKPFLKDDKWFFQLSGILNRENQKQEKVPF